MLINHIFAGIKTKYYEDKNTLPIIFYIDLLQLQRPTGGENGSRKHERTYFQMVSVPSVITEPEERAAYLVKHYWDKFDFTDTTLIHFPEITEQATSNYIDMMKYVPAKSGCFFYQRDDE